MIVRSQNMHIAIPKEKIRRTELQHKEPDNIWLVVAVVEGNRALTLARYPSEKDALSADNRMWLSDEEKEMYAYPILCGREEV